jgi:ABC-type spermidine/putrescine transport system permease subunit II
MRTVGLSERGGRIIEMREITLIDTGCLCVLLVFCLVLPLMVSLRNGRDTALKRGSMTTVWIGQGIGVLCGFAVLASSMVAPYATVVGVMSYVWGALVLHRQLRQVPPQNAPS